jgi:uncharacterized protein (TIGR03437 family)
LYATPTLRMVGATVGPVNVASGGTATTQVIEAYNIGDGSLSLSLTSSATWITPALGASHACTTTFDARTCIPIQLALNTSGLPTGMSTGIVTVTDPNALDSPQTITVTVRVGAIDLYVPANGSRDATFATTSQVIPKVSTQDGNQWMTVALDGTGSFRFSFPYKVHLAPPASMSAGTYNGSIVTTGATATADNQTIPVTMRVTTQPIAQASPEFLSLRLAQGAPPQVAGIGVSNAGQGTLTVQGATATGSGLSVQSSAGGAVVTYDAGTLATGVYTGSIAITTNAVNGTVTIPVRFEVVGKSTPLISYGGVVDDATFGAGAVNGGDILAVFGEQFSFSAGASGSAPPLVNKIGTTRVLVNGQAVPLFYSSYSQINFQVPANLNSGTALVQVERDGQTGNTATVPLAVRAPRILVVVNQNGSLPMPALSPGTVAHVGDALTIYAIGLGQTSPAVTEGNPAPAAEPLARLTAGCFVNFGGGIAGLQVEPFYAGLTPYFAGLYQVNIIIPEGSPKGIVPINLGFNDSASNTVLIAIQ